MSSIFPGPDVMIYGPGNHDGKNVDKSCAWMSMNTTIEEKYKSKITVVAWIHFGGNEISSINLHTQNIWSKQYPNILEIVIQDAGESMKNTLKIYGLTTEGKEKLTECKKPIDQVHYECQSDSFRESKMDSVKFINGSIEVVHDIFEVMSDDPMLEKSNHTNMNQYIVPNNVIEKFLNRAQTIRRKTLAFLAGIKDGNVITVTHLIIPTKQEFQLPIGIGKYYIIKS